MTINDETQDSKELPQYSSVVRGDISPPGQEANVQYVNYMNPHWVESLHTQ
jgi:hypothetical protein